MDTTSLIRWHRMRGVCNMHLQLAKGGRPRKPLVGCAAKPDSITPYHHFSSLVESHESPMSLDGFILLCSLYTYPMCKQYLTNPVETPCKHISCLNCIRSQFHESPTMECIVCQQEVYFRSVHRVADNFQQTLNFACIECNQCKVNLPLSRKGSHQCRSSGLSCSQFTTPPDDPLTPRTERIGTTILKRKLLHSSDGLAAHFKTGGQVYLCKHPIKDIFQLLITDKQKTQGKLLHLDRKCFKCCYNTHLNSLWDLS